MQLLVEQVTVVGAVTTVGVEDEAASVASPPAAVEVEGLLDVWMAAASQPKMGRQRASSLLSLVFAPLRRTLRQGMQSHLTGLRAER